MGLHYEERAALSKALRRHVKEEPLNLPYTPEYKSYLYSLISTFEERGYGAIIDADDQNAFQELFEHATY